MSGHGNQHLDSDSTKPSPHTKHCFSMLTLLQCLPQWWIIYKLLPSPLVAFGHGVTATERKLVQKETTRMRFPTHDPFSQSTQTHEKKRHSWVNLTMKTVFAFLVKYLRIYQWVLNQEIQTHVRACKIYSQNICYLNKLFTFSREMGANLLPYTLFTQFTGKTSSGGG